MHKVLCSIFCFSLACPNLIGEDNASSRPNKKYTKSEIAQGAKEKTSSKPKKAIQKPSEPQKNQIITNNPKHTHTKASASPSAPALLASSEDSQLKHTTAPKEDCIPGPNSFRFSLAHREGRGIGYPEGYSSADMFLCFSTINNIYPFFDIRVHIFNDGNPAANAGFGVRYIPNSINAVFGANLFCDFKQSSNATFEQLGAGIEILGTQWSLYANGYFPIIQSSYTYLSSLERASNLSFYEIISTETALKGVDVNLGRSIVQRGYFDLTSYFGGYYFEGHQNISASGGYIKLASNITRFISTEIQGSYDTLFKGIFQGAISLNFPVGKRIKTSNPNRSCYNKTALAIQASEHVNRFEMIVSKTKTTQKLVSLTP